MNADTRRVSTQNYKSWIALSYKVEARGHGKISEFINPRIEKSEILESLNPPTHEFTGQCFKIAIPWIVSALIQSAKRFDNTFLQIFLTKDAPCDVNCAFVHAGY